VGNALVVKNATVYLIVTVGRTEILALSFSV
jgi:hypothetical protein